MESSGTVPEFQSVIKELIETHKIKNISRSEVEFKKKIGGGKHTEVYRGIYQDTNVAVKVLEMAYRDYFNDDFLEMMNLNHPNIPKFYGIIFERDFLALIFEFIEGKTLDQYKISEFPEDAKLSIVKELSSVLEYIHSQKFIHKNLEPENIIIDDNLHIYVINFGIEKIESKIAELSKYRRIKTIIHYFPPEYFDVLCVDDIGIEISSKVDVWAFGCIVSFLYSGHLPWCNKYIDNFAILQKVLMKKLPFPIPSNITNQTIIEIIEMATRTETQERCEICHIVEILNRICPL